MIWRNSIAIGYYKKWIIYECEEYAL
jgi:hypothetical protein